ncbi:hypothetical protein HN709_03080 [Candidatus Peregrinibacteria bacterium]|jgi:hypothetical protein|nr:hypothetical protein [Candidatus Peregrinibacteria bacterium]MBT7736647.1 hypothetical protein [Candidatus Peregrinibacteria bacterium]
MFITLTIDTNIKKKNPVNVRKSSISPSKGWRKPLHFKKRTLSQRFKDWKKSWKGVAYKMDGQTAMF